MAYSNSAAWLDAKDTKLRVGPAENHKPGKGEVLVEVHAVAINPVDVIQAQMGFAVNQWPYICGEDVAGVVVEVGEGVKNVSPGSRVLGGTHFAVGSEKLGGGTIAKSAFQKYAIVDEIYTTPIPDQMSFVDASVIPLAYLTAHAGLYWTDALALPLPNVNVKKADKSLLIWGGAASVGCMAIQLATASGFDVITTCSPRNFELCKSLGAKHVFDYNSSSVVQDIIAVLKDTNVAGVHEASGAEDGLKKSAEILSSVGGGFISSVQMIKTELPSNVKAEFCLSAQQILSSEKDVRYLWQEFLPAALKSGQIRPAPQAEVAGKGLESVQDGLDAWKRGVSAKKIVVEI